MTNSANCLISHRKLLWRTTVTELKSRYAGSILGLLWVVLGPGLLLGLYAVIYLNIWPQKIADLTPPEFVLFLFAGLIPFFMTAESLSLGVGSVIANRAVLENTVFPIDLAPAKSVLSGQSAMVAGLPVVLIGVVYFGRFTWVTPMVLLLWALHCMALFGLGWILSLLNVVFRDLTNMIGVVLMALLIASPFAYEIESVPSGLGLTVLLNPFAYYVRAYQHILIWGAVPPTEVIVFVVLFSCGLFFAGGWFFARAKRVIIDYV